MEILLQDLRFGARSLARRPGFTFIAVLTLAIGIGANTAIYSVVDATLLRTLPFERPDRIMKVSLTLSGFHGRPPDENFVWSFPKYETFRQTQTVFENTALFRGMQFNLTGAGEAERLNVEQASASYFPILGVKPALGRYFLPEEDSIPATHFVAVLGYGLWQRRFGADPGIAGRTIRLDGRNYTVVGVAPPGFKGLGGVAEIWMPVMSSEARELKQRWSHSYEVIARLKPGITPEQARNAVVLLGKEVDRAHPAPFGNNQWGAKARLLDETRIDASLRKSVLVVFAAVGFVLLIACVNISNLLLARGGTRAREMAIRVSVGAGRGRLFRQLLTESVLLAVMGGAAGVAIACVGVQLLSSADPASAGLISRQGGGLMLIGLTSIGVDSRALAFTSGLALITGVLFGLAPAVAGSRRQVSEALKSGGADRGSTSHFAAGRNVLVVTEIALAIVLLAGAGLMIRSFGRLLANRTGVDAENVLTARIRQAFDPKTPPTGQFSELERRIAALPGVLSASTNNCHPLAGGCNGTVIWFRDREPVPKGTEQLIGVHFASPDYFKTMRIPLIAGRLFTPADRTGAPKVVLVNETAARKFWPGESALGKPVGVGQGGFDDRAEVVGVVGDVRYGQMDEPPTPDVYISTLQSPRWSTMLFVRVTGSPLSYIPALRRELAAIDKELTTYDIETMNGRIRDATAKARYSAILLGTFAAIALVLAAVGIHGVMAYAVSQRTREIGIRIALGARPADVLSLVLRRGLALAAAGLGIGMLAALGATRVLKSLLYEVTPVDPMTYVAVGLALSAVSLAAIWAPAWRATRIAATEALRAD